MKKWVLVVITLLAVITLSACDTAGDPCGEGTHLEGNTCVLDDETSNNTGGTPVVQEGTCATGTGLHTVKGGSPYTISEWLNWKFIGGHLVSDPDNAWIMEYGAAIFNVHTVANHAWEGSFTQSGMFLTAGCEYTFSFTLRTEAPSIKPNVIVFGENTSGFSFFQETVDLSTDSTTYTFTVTPTTSDYVSTGVYFANSVGVVIIENVQIYSGQAPASE